MKNTFTLLATLLLAPLAALHAGRKLPGVPRFVKLPAGSFQALETSGAMADDDKPTEKPQKKKRRQKAGPPAPQQERLCSTTMKRILPVIAASLLALAFGPALHAQTTTASLADEHTIDIPEVSRVIARHFPQGSPGGIGVLITRNGEAIHRRGYGAVKGNPLTPQSPLRLASISKQFAAMCAAMLIEEGKLDPKAKVSRYLPEVILPVKGRELLVQDLLWHISGLPNFMNKKEQASIAEFRKQRGLQFLSNQTHAEWLATMSPVREPGKLWEYTNSGYVLLARLIEVIVGEPFHRFQKRRILDVLGMAYTTDSERFNGSGNMETTLNDYAKWDRALWEEDKRLLSPAGYRMLFTPGTLDDGTPVGYGFGWNLNYEGNQLVSADHGGGGSGSAAARNFVRRHFSDRTTVAIFAQEHPSLDLNARKALVTEIYEAQRNIAREQQ